MVVKFSLFVRNDKQEDFLVMLGGFWCAYFGEGVKSITNIKGRKMIWAFPSFLGSGYPLIRLSHRDAFGTGVTRQGRYRYYP